MGGRSGSSRKGKRTKRLSFVQEHGRCYYCGLTVEQREPPHPRAATLDHLIPACRGGKNTWGNLVLSCYLCNHEKSDMTEAEFRAYRRHKMRGVPKREALRLARSATAAQELSGHEGTQRSRREGDVS